MKKIIYQTVIVALCGLFALQTAAITVDRNITIGMSFSLSASTTLARVDQGRRTNDGVIYWYENLPNKVIYAGNQTIGVNIVIYDDRADAATMRSLYTQMASDPNIDFLVGPVNSDFSVMAKSITEPRQKLLVGTSAATSAFYLGGQWSFAAVTSARNLVRAAVSVMRIKGAKTIGIIYDSVSPFAADACLAQRQSLSEQGLTVSGMVPIPSTLAAVTDELKNNVSDAVRQMKEINPDVVLGCIHAPQLQEHSLLAMQQIDWVPKLYTVAPDSGGYFQSVSNVTKNALSFLSAFDATARFAHKGVNFNDSFAWSTSFRARFGYEPDSYNAFGTLAPLLLQRAIERAGSVNPASVRDNLRTLDIETFMGRVSFAADGANQNSGVMQQFQNGARRIIAPPLFADADAVYPMPAWSERTFSQTFGSGSEIAVIVITSIGALFSLVLIVLLAIAWKDPIIRASSPTFLCSVIIGSLLLYSSNYASLINVITPASCHLQAWLLALGFIVMYGSLFAKSWRVWRLYSNASMTIIRISDLQVFLNVLIWVLIMAILLIAFSIAGNLQPTYVTLDPYRPARDYIACIPANPGPHTVALAVILAYSGLIILAGLFVAYKVSKIPYQVYDESNTISFSMYNVAFFVILLAALRLSNAASREVLFVLQSVGLVLCVVITLSSLLFTKVSYMMNGDSSLSGTSLRMSRSVKHLSSSKASGGELSQTTRDELKEYKERVNMLETLLKKNKIKIPDWKHGQADPQ